MVNQAINKPYLCTVDGMEMSLLHVDEISSLKNIEVIVGESKFNFFVSPQPLGLKNRLNYAHYITNRVEAGYTPGVILAHEAALDIMDENILELHPVANQSNMCRLTLNKYGSTSNGNVHTIDLGLDLPAICANAISDIFVASCNNFRSLDGALLTPFFADKQSAGSGLRIFETYQVKFMGTSYGYMSNLDTKGLIKLVDVAYSNAGHTYSITLNQCALSIPNFAGNLQIELDKIKDVLDSAFIATGQVITGTKILTFNVIAPTQLNELTNEEYIQGYFPELYGFKVRLNGALSNWSEMGFQESYGVGAFSIRILNGIYSLFQSSSLDEINVLFNLDEQTNEIEIFPVKRLLSDPENEPLIALTGVTINALQLSTSMLARHIFDHIDGDEVIAIKQKITEHPDMRFVITKWNGSPWSLTDDIISGTTIYQRSREAGFDLLNQVVISDPSTTIKTLRNKTRSLLTAKTPTFLTTVFNDNLSIYGDSSLTSLTSRAYQLDTISMLMTSTDGVSQYDLSTQEGLDMYLYLVNMGSVITFMNSNEASFNTEHFGTAEVKETL